MEERHYQELAKALSGAEICSARLYVNTPLERSLAKHVLSEEGFRARSGKSEFNGKYCLYLSREKKE